MILDILVDAVYDGVFLLPFLFLAYLFMEAVEHRSSDKMENALKKMGRFGPLIGSFLGCVPQCGFSASAASLYSAGIISCGTLMAVFLSTSDEALPILIASQEGRGMILPLISCKLIISLLVGFTLDLILKNKKSNKEKNEVCKNCGCSHEKGILKPAVWHTVHILAFIIVINIVLNSAIEFLGEESISQFLLNGSLLQPFAVAAFGLIPNCAVSVAITELYLSHSLSFGATLAGLCANGGAGLAVLFSANKNKTENFKIVAILYTVSVLFGVILQLF